MHIYMCNVLGMPPASHAIKPGDLKGEVFEQLFSSWTFEIGIKPTAEVCNVRGFVFVLISDPFRWSGGPANKTTTHEHGPYQNRGKKAFLKKKIRLENCDLWLASLSHLFQTRLVFFEESSVTESSIILHARVMRQTPTFVFSNAGSPTPPRILATKGILA